jgi:hypothetical protein
MEAKRKEPCMERSPKGPEIASTTSPTSIEGVELMKAPTVKYEYGHLTEFYNPLGKQFTKSQSHTCTSLLTKNMSD